MAAGSGTIAWSPHPNTIKINTELLWAATFDRFSQLMDASAARWEALAKTGAPWTDRTGAARAGIRGTSHTTQSGGEIAASYSVDYGVWLELANQGRYATIIPTAQIIVGEVQNGLRGLFG